MGLMSEVSAPALPVPGAFRTGVMSALASLVLVAILEVPAVTATAVGLGFAGGGLLAAAAAAAALSLSAFLSADVVPGAGLVNGAGGIDTADVVFPVAGLPAVVLPAVPLVAAAPGVTPAGWPAAEFVVSAGCWTATGGAALCIFRYANVPAATATSTAAAATPIIKLLFAFLPSPATVSNVPRLGRCSALGSVRLSSRLAGAEIPTSSATGAVLMGSTLETTGNAAARAAGAEGLITTGGGSTGEFTGFGIATGAGADGRDVSV